MEQFIKETEGQVINDLLPLKECSDKKNSFFECVITQKNELSKNMAGNDWHNYRFKVQEIETKCFKEGDLGSCDKYFSLYDINY